MFLVAIAALLEKSSLTIQGDRAGPDRRPRRWEDMLLGEQTAKRRAQSLASGAEAETRDRLEPIQVLHDQPDPAYQAGPVNDGPGARWPRFPPPPFRKGRGVDDCPRRPSPQNGADNLIADLYDASGALVRSITVDTAFNSNAIDPEGRPARRSLRPQRRRPFRWTLGRSGMTTPSSIRPAARTRPKSTLQCGRRRHEGRVRNVWGRPALSRRDRQPGLLYPTILDEGRPRRRQWRQIQQALVRSDNQMVPRLYDVVAPTGSNEACRQCRGQPVARTQLGCPQPGMTREVLDAKLALLSRGPWPRRPRARRLTTPWPDSAHRPTTCSPSGIKPFGNVHLESRAARATTA